MPVYGPRWLARANIAFITQAVKLYLNRELYVVRQKSLRPAIKYWTELKSKIFQDISENEKTSENLT